MTSAPKLAETPKNNDAIGWKKKLLRIRWFTTLPSEADHQHHDYGPIPEILRHPGALSATGQSSMAPAIISAKPNIFAQIAWQEYYSGTLETATAHSSVWITECLRVTKPGFTTPDTAREKPCTSQL